MTQPSSTADDILTCARALILRGGFNGFSYADIADVVNIRKASIHHHFPTKVDLVRVLVARYREDAKAGLAALDRAMPDPRERLGGYVAYWQGCIVDPQADMCVCALLSAELPALPPDVATEVKAHFRTLADWLTALFAQGAGMGHWSLREAPRIEAERFMATIHGAMLSARAHDDAAVFTRVSDAAMRQLSA